MASWTLNGVVMSAMAIKSLRRSRKSQTADQVTFTAAGLAIDAAPLLAFGATAIIQKDGTTWFNGTCTSNPRQGSGAAESQGYTLQSAWYQLDRLVYQQQWPVKGPGPTDPVVMARRSRVVLCCGDDGARVSTAAEIGSIISWARACGVAVQLSINIPAVLPPFDEQIDITCGAALRKLLHWTPNAATWMDYATVPPTLCIGTRANVTPLTLTLGVSPIRALSITPRNDLLVPSVYIKYEAENTNDGASFRTVTVDAAGSGGEQAIGALVATVQLAGSNSTKLKQKIKVMDLPATAEDANFWKRKYPFLAASGVSNLTLSAGDIKVQQPDGTWGGSLGNTVFPGDRELLAGQVQQWMLDDDALLTSDRYRMTVKASYSIEDEDFTDHLLATEVNVTNADNKTYQKQDQSESAESIPTGVAATLYAALSTLHYDGQITLVEQEVAGTIHPGTVLNITGGAAAWATMAAHVQAVEESVDDGLTAITFGPPDHLSPQDLKELCFTNRSRNAGNSAKEKANGGSTAGTNPVQDVSGNTASSASGPGAPKYKKMVIDDGAGHTLTLDPADSSDTTFNLIFITDYGTTGAALHSIPVRKMGDVLVITGAPTDLSPYSCPGS